MMNKEQWLAAAYEGLDGDWPVDLVKKTKRLGKSQIAGWLSDDTLGWPYYRSGLALAKQCGITFIKQHGGKLI